MFPCVLIRSLTHPHGILIWLSFPVSVTVTSDYPQAPLTIFTHRVSLVAQTVKNLPAMWDTKVRSLGWKDPLEKGIATYPNILAWRTPQIDGHTHTHTHTHTYTHYASSFSTIRLPISNPSPLSVLIVFLLGFCFFFFTFALVEEICNTHI